MNYLFDYFHTLKLAFFSLFLRKSAIDELLSKKGAAIHATITIFLSGVVSQTLSWIYSIKEMSRYGIFAGDYLSSSRYLIIFSWFEFFAFCFFCLGVLYLLLRLFGGKGKFSLLLSTVGNALFVPLILQLLLQYFPIVPFKVGSELVSNPVAYVLLSHISYILLVGILVVVFQRAYGLSLIKSILIMVTIVILLVILTFIFISFFAFAYLFLVDGLLFVP